MLGDLGASPVSKIRPPAVPPPSVQLLGDSGSSPVSKLRPPVLPPPSIEPQGITPVCLNRGEIPASEMHWLSIPEYPAELATNEEFALLSGHLIQAGIVNASDCPLGGLWPGGSATACGLAKAAEASRYFQNVYDDEILAAGQSTGVPPVLIKQLIRYETQFWPVQWGRGEYGLGNLTHVGAGMAVFWNRELYETVFEQAPVVTDLAGGLLSVMDAYCATCPYGVDLQKAERSIAYIAKVLLAYCKQTTQIVRNAAKIDPDDVVDYATIWKLTLVNYNAGPLCAMDAIQSNFQLGSKLAWEGIADDLEISMCIRGVAYADAITAPYYRFATPR